jgi:hypothetical protein
LNFLLAAITDLHQFIQPQLAFNIRIGLSGINLG